MQQTARGHWWLRAGWQWQHAALAVGHIWVYFQIWPVVGVGCLPLVFVAFKLTAVADERCLGRQCQHLCFLADPIVVHALGIFGVTHKARHVQAAIDFKFVAHNTHDRDPFAGPLVFGQDFIPVDLAVLDLGVLHDALALRFAVDRLELLVFTRTSKSSHVAWVQVKRAFFVVDVIVVSDADRVLVQPVADGLVTHAQRLQRRDGRSVWIHAFVLSSGHVFSNEAPLGIRARWILDEWVHVDRERVANTANLNVLVECVRVAVFSQDADVAFAVGNLVLTRCVVRHVGVRDVLDVPNHAVEDICHFHVGVVIHGDNFGAWAVLTHVVRDLMHVLRQFVDCQCGARVDGLPLHRAAGGQDVRWPLPVVVRRASVEAQVVHLIFAALSERRYGHVKP